jgi:tight adherence protein C
VTGALSTADGRPVLIVALTVAVVFAGRRVVLHRPPTIDARSIDARPPVGTARVARPGSHRAYRLQLRLGRVSLQIPVVRMLPVAGLCLISPVLAVAAAVLTFAHAVGAQRRAGRARRRAWSAHVPDLVELVRLAIGSGCTTHLTLILIARHAGGPVGDMLDRTAVSLREGLSTAEALVELQERVGPAVRPLCSALLGSERYGLPVSATLEALAVEARLSRQREAELRSKRLPVLLIFPLVTCILPAFALLTVVPLLGGGLTSLSW